MKNDEVLNIWLSFDTIKISQEYVQERHILVETVIASLI